MDAPCRLKFPLVFSICACIVILMAYLHDIHTHNENINVLKESVFKAAKQAPKLQKGIEKTTSTRSNKKILNFKTYADPFLVSMRHLLALSVKAVQVGGVRLRDVRKQFDIDRYGRINTENPIRAAHLSSYKAMYYVMKNSFPKIQIVSKQGYNKAYKFYNEDVPDLPWIDFDDATEDIAISSKDILVWIDPLDGSKSFFDNNLEYVTTMVCVAVKGKPVIGVIHQPFENVTTWGWDGIHFSNATVGHVSESYERSGPSIIISTMHADDLRLKAKVAFGSTVKVVAANGAGYKLLQLAVGNVDAYIHAAPLKKWDICAGNAIIKAMNGNMTGFNGRTIDYGNYSDVTHGGGIFGTIFDHENYLDLTSATNSTYGSEE